MNIIKRIETRILAALLEGQVIPTFSDCVRLITSGEREQLVGAEMAGTIDSAISKFLA